MSHKNLDIFVLLIENGRRLSMYDNYMFIY
jgi:hypothetical protein